MASGANAPRCVSAPEVYELKEGSTLLRSHCVVLFLYRTGNTGNPQPARTLYDGVQTTLHSSLIRFSLHLLLQYV